MFLKGVHNLKIMGFLANSKQHMFIFKKNYFGKPYCRLETSSGKEINNKSKKE